VLIKYRLHKKHLVTVHLLAITSISNINAHHKLVDSNAPSVAVCCHLNMTHIP